jgi:hypothetical protein
LSGTIRPRDFIGFDIETSGDDNLFYSGGIYWYDNDVENFEYFTNKDRMVEFMIARKFRNKFIVATNLDFDLTALFYNTKYWNKLKLTMRNGKVIQAKYDLGNNNGSIKFIDTCNYVFWSVEKLGEILGTPKLKHPSFLGERTPLNEEEFEEMKTYNKRDCKVSCDFMYFFQEGVNKLGGNCKITIASTALGLWRMKHQPQDIIKEEYILKNDNIKEFIFNGYYGGRTEVFKRGIFKNLFYYDVNSLYPSVMVNDFPLPQSVKVVFPAIENISDFMGVTKAKVTCPTHLNKPFLPYHTKEKLLFPSGTFIGTWNNCELDYALKLGYDVEPLEQIIYTDSWKPFKSYVTELYNMRKELKEKNDNMELVVKLLLNSLYGKFATKNVEELTIFDMNNFEGTVKEMEKIVGKEFQEKNGIVMITKQKKFNGLYTFPILSSYVTSYARILMYPKLNNPNVIYTDTDSIVLQSNDYTDSRELGELKLESTHEVGMFIKPKFYILDDKPKIKGISKASKNDFYSIVKGNSVSKMKFSRLKESVRSEILPNKKMFIEKTLSLIDNKRVWEHEDLSRCANSTPIILEAML